MEIARNTYLEKLRSKEWNGLIKVITGIRRCGKSYLLFNLFKNELISSGIDGTDIIEIRLDDIKWLNLRHPVRLYEYIESRCSDGRKKYVFIDEIQFVPSIDNPYDTSGAKITFFETLNSLLNLKNIDVYVTGSNSKMLSKDILTQFRGRGDELRVHPLSFSEYYQAVKDNMKKEEAFVRFTRYGGMPALMSLSDDEQRENYLKDLFKETYIKDISERYEIERLDAMDNIIDLLCSSIGSLTNPRNIADSVSGQICENTARRYLDLIIDSFLFNESKRYDVKGRQYFSYPMKYYCEDIGLRNARIGFRQQEITHIMENIIYNELILRGFNVDVGVVTINSKDKNGTSIRIGKEIDFVANKGCKRLYIQSAYAIDSDEKKEQEISSFRNVRDSFMKVLIRMDTIGKWNDEQGILHINLLDFLLDRECL